MPVNWSTLITEGDQGQISLHRLRKFSSIVAFWFAVAIVMVATAIEVLTKIEVPTDMVMIAVGALVLPITGGQVSDAIFQSRVGRKIEAGEAPGRRSSDTLVPPPAG